MASTIPTTLTTSRGYNTNATPTTVAAESGPSRRYQCTFCHMHYSARSSLRDHEIAAHTLTRFECSICRRLFNRRNVLRQHKRRVHDKVDTDRFKCLGCGDAFNKKGNHTRHLRTCNAYKRLDKNEARNSDETREESRMLICSMEPLRKTSPHLKQASPVVTAAKLVPEEATGTPAGSPSLSDQSEDSVAQMIRDARQKSEEPPDEMGDYFEMTAFAFSQHIQTPDPELYPTSGSFDTAFRTRREEMMTLETEHAAEMMIGSTSIPSLVPNRPYSSDNGQSMRLNRWSAYDELYIPGRAYELAEDADMTSDGSP